MCSVHALLIDDHADPIDRLSARLEFAELVRAGSCRGRDSFGIVTDIGEQHSLGSSGDEALALLTPPSRARWAIANCRAEPTTEWVPDKLDLTSVQPFTHHGITVAHNGTVANDKALADELGAVLASRVDSEVLPWLLHQADLDNLVEQRKLLGRIEGSFGIVAADHAQHGLLVATNWRPLRVCRRPGAWLVTSLTDEQRGHTTWHSRAFRLHLSGYVDVPARSLLWLAPDGNMIGPLDLDEQPPDRHTLVVASGGMDSTVAATAAALLGPVTLLHMTYGCEAQEREVDAVHTIAARIGAKDLIVVDLGNLFTQLAPSPLTTGAPVAAGEAGAEFAHEWVPARNLVLMAVATAIAEAGQFTHLSLGINLEEAGAYPDNEQEFIHRLNKVMAYAVGPRSVIPTIEQPVGHLVKHEVVALGLALGAPLDVTWSCYRGGAIHCGKCGPCFMRRTAFKMLGARDSVLYGTLGWDGPLLSSSEEP